MTESAVDSWLSSSMIRRIAFVCLRMETAILKHDCVETVVIISCIFDRTLGTVWFDQTVTALHDAAVAFLVLAFHVASVLVFDIIGKMVLGVCMVVGYFVFIVQRSYRIGCD